MNGKNTTYFDRFVVVHIRKEIKRFIRNKNTITNIYIYIYIYITIYIYIYRTQAHNLIMCGYFSIRFIDFMLKGKSLQYCTNLFSPN